MKFHKVLEWSDKYSTIKSFEDLSKGTMSWYQWCAKIGRTTYLKKSRIKTKKFLNKNPNNLNFRVFKSTVLKGKKVNPLLMNKFKSIVEKKGTKGATRYGHLAPKELYFKMKRINPKA